MSHRKRGGSQIELGWVVIKMPWRQLALVLGYCVGLLSPASGATAAESQTCLEAGLAKPGVVQPLAMHHAGIRPLTPGRYFSQGTNGVFLFGALPNGCAPTYVRSMDTMLQIQRRTDRRDWINVGAKNGDAEQPGNNERHVRFSSSPNHAWPDYAFNECVGGKGWLKVRAVLMVKVKDGETHEVLDESRYVFPAKVYGSCKAARQSAKATEDYEEEWGGGSGASSLNY